MQNCLEIGPGKTKISQDWTTVNVIPSSCTDVIAKWGYESLPFEDNTFDLVYASHVLEHIIWYKTVDALQEAYRILKPGGKIEIWVPDFAKIVGAYLTEQMVDDWDKYNPDHESILSVNGRIFTYEPDTHKCVFNEKHLKSCLFKAGFDDINRIHKPRGYDHGYIGLGVGGTK